MSLIETALQSFAKSLREKAEITTQKPSEWIESCFYVPDPRDPITGEQYPPGPIRLAEHQKRIIDAALERDAKGRFLYNTVIYSAPKKSGKSAITSAVILYIAYHQPHSFAACLANDGTQSKDRLYGPIYTNFILHKQLGGIFEKVLPNLDEVTLPNMTKIRAVPCDAAGEAGSQPVISAFSELWGYTSEKKKRLWTEMTVPPTLYGKALRWVETYAGYSGESELLEQLYETGFTNGQPHPDFEDLQGDDGPVVRVNKSARMFTYWDSGPNAHRMYWQQGEEGELYYQSESSTLPPIEMQRIHYNRWVSSITSFVQDAWWEACVEERLPPLIDKHTPVVVGIDMAVSRDCAALVAVTRNPFDPDYSVAVRGVRVFSPKAIGGIIDQETLVRPVIEDWAKRWNVVCWVYDPHEMAKLAQDLVRSGVGWFKPFGQVQPRAVSDKQLHDMILHKQVVWSPNTTEGDVGYKGTTQETLYKHIIRAGATTKSDSYRIEKLSTQTHIDAAVALSQAAFTCMKLNLSSREMNQNALIEKLRTHQITMEEFLNAQRQRTT